MTLSFSQQINGKPTHFIDRIWNGLQDSNMYLPESITKYKLSYREQFGEYWPTVGPHQIKVHTIRLDSSDRWKAGNLIHFIINNRTKDRFQFAPVLTCIHTQDIQIDPNENHVRVTGRILSAIEVESLAWNDGFDSVQDFWNYFKDGLIGKIIHWTDLAY